MTPELPESIGRYVVEAAIGTGAFATVYRARDERLDATVAIKVLAENHSLDPEIRRRFIAEGRTLRRIRSPHVVAVYDLGQTERGQPYLVLDHADRGDVAGRVRSLRADGWVPGVADLSGVARALGDGLAAVHLAGLVHRDVAPRNLLLRSVETSVTSGDGQLVAADEQILLADLGMSKDLVEASGLPVGGGTAGFRAPEQREEVGRVASTTDVWAASAVLVWLLLDRHPDDGGRWREDLAAAGWSPTVVDALAQGLAADPAERPGDVTPWVGRLLDAATPVPPPARLADPIVDVPRSPPLRPWARARRAASAAVVLAAAVQLPGSAVVLDRALTDDDDQTVEDLGDGRVRVSASRGDSSIAIVGPAEMTTGSPATFEAEARAVESWLWIDPDGAVHPDIRRMDVTARSPGSATVTLIGVDDDTGEHVQAQHRLPVGDG
jgi:eukaryotic-like serine/threonine-protein kinase